MTRLWLVSPLGILFAWSGAWTCQTYTLPDGGTATFSQNPGTGSGVQGGQSATVIAVYTVDGGGTGISAGPDGGVTVGPAAAFSSNFVYMSNYLDGTVSRISVPTSGSPSEQARYSCLTPLDNHGINMTLAPSGGCPTCAAIWPQGQMNLSGSSSAATFDSPSRTVVDRSGNVWIALRAPNGGQAGLTEIANVGDNIAQCVPHCVQRAGLLPFDGTAAHNSAFTEGVQLKLSPAGSGTVTLSPPNIINPGSAYATQYPCQDVGKDSTGTVWTAPENYDDCIVMSIPLGAPNPDPLADPSGLTKNYSFGRAMALSPHCNAATDQCDVWLGMWNGAGQVLLGYSMPTTSPNHNANNKPFDVVQVFATGVQPYGSTVDCAGIVWSGTVATGTLSAITTVALNAPQYGLSIPAYTQLSPAGGIPNSSSCGQYGISSDVSEHIWIASYPNEAYACSFNAAGLLSNYNAYMDGGITPAAMAADLAAAWSTYNVGAQYPGSNSRGINTDMNGNVYMAFDATPAGVTAFNPNQIGPGNCVNGAGGCAAVPCGTPNIGGSPCPYGTFLWPSMAANSQGASVGVDLDLNGNVWAGNQNPGSATEFNGLTGALMNVIALPPRAGSAAPASNGTYSYSDFTGYALRNVTLASGLYTQPFFGCSQEPELTEWQQLTYNVVTPNGTDAEIEVQPTNSLSPAVLATESPITVCQSVNNGNCVGTPGQPGYSCQPCCEAITPYGCHNGGTINLAPYNIPGADYLVVDVLLYPAICSQYGGVGNQAEPVLYNLGVQAFCPGN